MGKDLALSLLWLRFDPLGNFHMPRVGERKKEGERERDGGRKVRGREGGREEKKTRKERKRKAAVRPASGVLGLCWARLACSLQQLPLSSERCSQEGVVITHAEQVRKP